MMRILFSLVLLFISGFTFAQGDNVYIHPNRGQWDSEILYNVDLHNGQFYFDQAGYTILLREFNHHDHHNERNPEESKNYAFKIKYIGANQQQPEFEEEQPSLFYRNYFLGNDSTRWKNKVYSFRQLTRKNLYPGIDVITKGNNKGEFEIDYQVAPMANPLNIQLLYEGFNQLSIEEDGSLKMTHPLGWVSESKPIAWNKTASGERIPVEVVYQLKDNVVSFAFPNGYDSSLELIIDPVLAFSTFTGAQSDNWGFTAAPDPQGNAFGGGIVFGPKYPFSAGAYDTSFGGGTVDAAISKFSSDGTQLLYSTFIGGSSSETPHSIVSNAAGEIYVLGITGSSNFPVSTNAYQQTFKGGSYSTANGISYAFGTDIFVLKLNATGTQLQASTLLGGIANDGLSLNDLNYNYGDQFRGDITLDAAGNIYVASTSYSPDFPLANPSAGYGGLQDGVAFKMNGNLSQLLWSTYIGGNQYDAAYSVQVANDGSIYIAGGSNSPNFSFPSGIKTTPYGGTDGFIAKYSSTYQLQRGTFVGTPQYDQVYFLQLDLNQNVYVFGQTLGNMPITSGKYNNGNSGQFIRKYDATFSNEIWTTLIGSGQKKIDISPTAFLVSDCFDIYFAGWGGEVNSSHSQATQSSTSGLPITSDAFQSTTNGSNFYIGVLKPDATGLKYGTFIGGTNSSANHVDGGTSRFDKSGKIYHSVCAACGGNPNGFTTTPGVYAPKNNSSNCNMAVFKFEISFIETQITNINPVVCYPGTIIFDNVSTTGDSYFWDFGDGTTSTQLNPTHTYGSPGNYTVSFVVHDTQNCFSSDTIKFPVEVKEFVADVIVPDDTICPYTSYQLHASGGSNYVWSPAEFLSNPTIANPIATVNETTTFTVKVTDNECGEIELQAVIQVFEDSLIINQDTSICLGASVPLSANGAVTYEWSPQTYLNNPNAANPTATPLTTTTYTVTGISENNCPLKASTKITVIQDPIPSMPADMTVCSGAATTLSASGATQYTWSPAVEISSTSGGTVVIHPTESRYYYCDFTNGCNTIRDSVYITVIHTDVKAWNDTIVCIGESVQLYASGAQTYAWSPTVDKLNPSGSEVLATPTSTTTYVVVGTDQYGCKASDNVTVTLYPIPFVQTLPDIYAIYGEEVQLGVQTDYPGTYQWYPSDSLSCVICPDPVVTPNQSTDYIVVYTDTNGCQASDVIHVYYEPLLWVPNTFTPDGDQFNNQFKFYGVNIADVKMDIYNRWGELIYTIEGFNDFWDGTYKGKPCPIGTYVWKIEYTDVFRDIILGKTGHVNLLR